MQWFKILNKVQIPAADSMKTVKVDGKQICIINTAGKIFASQAYCPHAGGHFDGGWCKNGHLVCPIHRYEYNLETGRGREGQGDYINLYPVEVREDGLYIGFKESWWSRLWG
ncbi:Rieske (2Fe-2S) protein [Pedobacter sp. MW01-1-1]|uniref:Rieske (2Fe-2S) protein n=1 Tax=Pedobacter sp. MW01-1-1 TaxID=3383027 RepID=UPI003FEFAC8F